MSASSRPHRVAEVADPQIGLALQRPERSLRQRPGLGCRVVARRDHRPGAEHFGRAQHCLDIVRVGHPVEQHHERRRAGRGGLAEIGEATPVQRLRLERRPLVDRLRVERRRELARIGHLRLDLSRRDGLGELCRGVRGHDQPVATAAGVHQRVAHRVQAEQPMGLGPVPAGTVARNGLFRLAGPLPVPCAAIRACLGHRSPSRQGAEIRQVGGERKGADCLLTAPGAGAYIPHTRIGGCAARCGSGL